MNLDAFKTEWRWPVALWIALVATYWLTFHGGLRSGDESWFLLGAQGLARTGKFQSGGVYGERGFVPPPVDVGQAWLAAPLDALAGALGVGSIHSMVMLNIYLTAGTAVLVYVLARQAGYLPSLSAGVMALYGWGTLAWPHSAYFFRDPAATWWAMLGVVAVNSALTASCRPAQLVAWLMAGAAFGVGGLTKQTALLVALAVGLWVLVRAWHCPSERASAVVGGALVLGLGALSLALPTTHVLSGWRWLGYLRSLFAPTDSVDWWGVWAGVLFSPGKSLWVSSPVLVLALVSVALSVRYRTKSPSETLPWLALGVFLLALPVYRGQVWFGGTGWGVRHTLVLIPLLAVACAPMLQRWASRPAWGWLVIPCAMLSLLVQLVGVLGNQKTYGDWLNDLPVLGASWTLAIWDVGYIELVGLWRTVWDGSMLAPAWARLWSVSPEMVLAWWGLALAGLALAGWLVVGRKAVGWALAAALLLVGVALPGLALHSLTRDPDFLSWREDYAVAIQQVQPTRTDWVLVRGQNYPVWKYIFNYARWPAAWWAYSPPLQLDSAVRQRAASNPAAAFNPAMQALFEAAVAQRQPVWLVDDGNAPLADLRLEEHWLAERLVPVWTAGAPTRVTYFVPQPADPRWQPLAVSLGSGVQVVATSTPLTATAGAVIPMGVQWQASQPLPGSWVVGVYLLNAEGALVSQRDSPPLNGRLPFDRWPLDTPLPDWHGLQVPPAASPGPYTLALTVYDAITGTRLPIPNTTDALLRLGRVDIQATPAP